MKNLIRSKNFYIMVLCDIVLVMTSYYLAFYLRSDGHIPEAYLALFKATVPLVVVTKIFFFFVFNLYRGMWRFTGINDLKNVVAATLLSSMTMTWYYLFLNQLQWYPRSVYVMDFALTLMFIGGIRLGVRMALNRGSILSQGFQGNGKDRKRIMVLGAGYTGEKVVREMLDSPGMKMKPVAFLDDNPGKSGKSIHGVPIKGRIKEIERFQDEFDEILIAIPSARGEQIREIVSACEKLGKRFRMMPSIGELIGGQISVKAIRDVRFEDLLGREEVRLDADLISQSYQDKRILITGAGGSIGSELVKQVGHYHPGALGLLDFSEYNLFQIDMATRRQFEYIPVKSYLSDIRIVNTLRRAFEDFRPHIVFHAAAYKHVPLQELNPREAIFNNIKGTRRLADMACEYEVERFVLVSTDKAVRSTSIMGASKRVAEMLLECRNGSCATRFIAVRFGNVLGSSGSVIPIFEQQIADRMPLTVTHPEVTRYFMSTSEAAQLILQAGAMGKGGEIFILDMGRPVKIANMARDLIRLHGLEPGKDIPIRFTGLRPGEKLYEELITEGEGIVPTNHEKIRVIRGRHCDDTELVRNIDELIELAKTSDVSAIKKKLKEIVPEYTPQ
jgi:FlaA1/EpsC-like NDP-sugar epimerase